ncbi:nuclear pore complex protein Nup154 [Anopheles stephensi]|uniref:Nucleoporin Nup133/Nup155-like N-terminal domain-containing protein n=1 Tax=Anopheles stephensi TaxID=30069 RepID=A0A182XZX6_ANOST|nr:nuclear pore complex protein Nup154 [Anopheles stephensi]
MGEQLPTVSLEALQSAGNTLERHGLIDVDVPGLLELTGVTQAGTPTASGLSDFDYQQLSNLSMGFKDLNQLCTVNKVPIPSEIMEHFNHIKCHCMMGLFPEIGRAWLTIDTDLYIWTYENARDVAYFDGLSQVIISVGLVTPKPGLFVADVKYLLILTTPIEIVVLGVTFGDANNGTPNRSLSGQNSEEMQLMHTPIFVLNTDNVAIMCVQGTDDGRIFLGGRDGCLYEVSYQAESNWFGKRCRKINHSQGLMSHLVPGIFKIFSETDSVEKITVDNTRNLLYVLMSKGSIEAWDLGKDAGSTRRIARLSYKEIISSASMILRTIDTAVFHPITAICPLTLDDSSSLHLVAIAESGVRFYFSTVPLHLHGFYIQQQQLLQQQQLQQQQSLFQQQQQQLQLQQQQQQQQQMHQQHQPHQPQQPSQPSPQQQLGASPNQEFQQNANLPEPPQGKPQGLYLLHVRVPPGITGNLLLTKPKLVHSAHYIQGSLLMISRQQQDQDLLTCLSSEQFQSQHNLVESTTYMPLDGQVWAIADVMRKDRVSITTPLRKAQNPRKVALLTNQGVHIVSILQSVDILQQLLVGCHGPHNEAVKMYFSKQTEPEACATALLLACRESFRGTEVGDWATQSFILYGGEPYFDAPIVSDNRQLGFSSPIAGGGGYGAMDSSVQQQHHHHNANFLGPSGRLFASSTPYSTPGSGGRGGMVSPVLRQQQQQQQHPSVYGAANVNNNNETVDASLFHYSAKHAGLYLYMSRMLRCIWRKPCVDERLYSTISQQDCVVLLEDLYAIRRFLENVTVSNLLGYTGGGGRSNGTSLKPNVGSLGSAFSQGQSGLLHGSTDRGAGFGSSVLSSQPGYSIGGAGYGYPQGNAAVVSQKHCTEEALVEERKSLEALVRLIKQACEVIGLWKVICEHQCHLLVGKLTKEEQSVLQGCTFRDLILSRIDVCGLLIVTLINSYLADNASVGSISSKLREVCPTLYRQEDAVSHKATEILLLSRGCTDRDKKEERLRTALQLCKSAAPNLPLGALCQQFVSAGFYTGVIELCTVCAAKSDPNEAGLLFYRNNEAMDNQEGFVAFQNRMSWYKEVKVMLDYVYDTAGGNGGGGAGGGGGGNGGGGGAQQPKPDSIYPSLEDDELLQDRAAGNQEVLQIIGQALQSTDPLLHIALYEWLLSKDLFAELLEITEPSLGVFLSRAMARTPENLVLADLLWKYHERNGQHAAAARILDKLANVASDSINLQQRIEYLARAVMCMRSESVGFSAHNGVLLKDLEDKLEVAQIQRQVYDALALLTHHTDERYDALKLLDSNLYNLTQLYSDFAEQYELWECKLTILNCSHHNDPLLIESVWTHILDRELQGRDSCAERCRRLLAKVKSLALEYDSSGCCFPLAFIVREVEIRCFRLGMHSSPVPDALIEMNLDIEELLNIYSRLVSMNERIWVTENDELYLIRSTAGLLSLIVNQPKLIPFKDRRKVMSKSQDLISAALNILYTKPDTQPLIDVFRDTQSKLQRIL